MAVIGVGNVAMDVARILGRTVDELYETDIADYALEALSHSDVEEIYVLGAAGTGPGGLLKSGNQGTWRDGGCRRRRRMR